MDRIVITWGLIPNENLSETIYCGDAENSETIELSFEIIGDDCKGIDNDFNFDVSGNQLWESNSNYMLQFQNIFQNTLALLSDFLEEKDFTLQKE